MAEEQKPEKVIPPYLPYSRFVNFIQSLRQAGLPSRIDRSLMGRFSGSEQSALINALGFLDLTTKEGRPTPKLAALYKAEGEDWKKHVVEILTASYTFLFNGDGFNIKNDSREQLEDQFKKAGASGDTIRKCIAFFLAAAKDAGIEVSPWFGTPRAARQGRRSRMDQRTTSRTATGEEEEADASGGFRTTQVTPVEFLYQLLDPAMNEEEQAAVWTLMKYLKKKGTTED